MEGKPEARPRLRVTPELLLPLRTALPWFLLGLVSFLVTPWLFAWAGRAAASGAYRHPALVAAFHVLILGWGTSVALAALQQLLRVLFPSGARHDGWGIVGFVLFLPGLLALVVGLLRDPSLVPAGALLLPAGVAVVVVKLFRVMRGPAATRQGLRIRPFVISALVYLLLAVAVGGALAYNVVSGWLGIYTSSAFPLHVTLAAGGWFAMLILGVSYHMLPFFGLTDKKQEPRRLGWVFGLLHGCVAAGVAGSLAMVAARELARLAFAVALILFAVAVAVFLSEHRSLFAPRERVRMHPTVGYIRAAHVSLTAFAFCLAAVAVLGRPMPAAGYISLGVLGVAGWVNLSILGYLHRILPFIVWHGKYWGRTSEPGVPAFRDMIPPRWAWTGFGTYLAGVLLMLVGSAGWISPEWGGVAWGIGSAAPAAVLLRAAWR